MASAIPRDEAELTVRCAALVARLETGWAKIDEGLAKGRDVRAWEDWWLTLLVEYERIDDELRALAPVQGVLL